MKNTRTRRFFFLLLSMTLLFSQTGLTALGAESNYTGGLCQHHPAHDDACGYSEGQPCGHGHTENCYTEELICGFSEDADTTEDAEQFATDSDAAHTHTPDCYKLNCPHENGEHDESCGYKAAAPCIFVCKECGTPTDSGEQGESQEHCSCEALCTEGLIDPDCLVCSADGADLSQCEGAQPDVPIGVSSVTVTAFDELAEEVQQQTVPAGTELDALNLPDTLTATGYTVAEDTEVLDSGTPSDAVTTPAAITIEGMTWALDPENEANDGNSAYDPAQGSYTFAPVLPEGYILADGLALPEIWVMVGAANVMLLANGETGDFTVQGGILGTDYSYSDNTLTITSGTALTISGTTTRDKIVVPNSVTANITLNGMNIDVSGTENACAFELQGIAEVNLTLEGENTLKSGRDKAGLQVPDNAAITIGGSGSLNVTGGNGGNGSTGLGGSNSGTISINGGKITATGGAANSLWDGRGGDGIFGNITIHGGITTSNGGNGSDKGGGGDGIFGNITIHGGITTSNGGNGGSGGNGGNGILGTVNINHGTITAAAGKPGWWSGGRGAGIGGSFSTSEDGDAVIKASSISNKGNQSTWRGIILDGNSGSVYGSQTLKTDLEISAQITFTIKDASSLTIDTNTTLTNKDTIIVQAGGTLTNNGTITNSGNMNIQADGTLTNSGAITNSDAIYVQADGTLDNSSGTIANSGTIYLLPSSRFTEGIITESGGKVVRPIDSVFYMTAEGIQTTQENVIPMKASLIRWDTGWYVVNENVTVTDRIIVTGDVHLILADSYTLTAPKGIQVTKGNSLTIYGQSGGTGKLEATGENEQAGIGAHSPMIGGGITINGGIVTAIGGGYSAGIGGASDHQEGGLEDFDNITINGGTVTATGGESAAGIGGHRKASQGIVTINGGTVKTTAGGGGAGIGSCETVTINGGVVNATGGSGGGTAIGSGTWGPGSTAIHINGGTITATKHESGSTAIGNADRSDSVKVVFISGGSLNATSMNVAPKTAGGALVYLGKLANQSGVTDVSVDGVPYYIAQNYTGDNTLYLYLTGENHTVQVKKSGTVYTYNATYVSGGVDGDTAKGYFTFSADGFGTTPAKETSVAFNESSYTAPYATPEVEVTLTISDAVTKNTALRSAAMNALKLTLTNHINQIIWSDSVTVGVEKEYTFNIPTAKLELGAYTLTAQYGGSATDKPAKAPATATLTITQATPEVTISAGAITYGQTLSQSSLNGSTAKNAANDTVLGAFAWQSNAGTVKPTVANNGPYSVTFTPTDTTHYAAVTKNDVTLTVNKKRLTPSVSVTGVSKPYDGNTNVIGTQPVLSLSGGLSGETPVATATYAYADADAAVGTNKTIVATVALTSAPVNANYELTTAEVRQNGAEITKATQTVTTAIGYGTTTFTYGDSPQTLTTPPVFSQTGTIVYTSSNESALTVAGDGSITIVGVGTATITATNTAANYENASSAVSLTVAPKSASAATVTVNGSYTYTGSALVPVSSNVAVTLNGVTILANQYTFAASNHTNAGTATLTVTFRNNYTGTATGSFTIGKAAGNDISGTVTGSYTGNGTTFTYTVTPISGAEYRMDSGNWQSSNVFSDIAPSSAHTFSARMPEDQNHNAGTAKSTASITFSKLDVTTPPTLDYSVSGASGSRTITITPVEGAEYQFGSDSWGDASTKAYNTDSTVTIGIRLKETQTHNASTAATATINLAKGDQESPVAFELIVTPNGEADYTVAIPEVAGCEYSFDGTSWSATNTKDNCTPGETITGYMRKAETNELNAGGATSATVTLPLFQVKPVTATPNGGSFSSSVSVTLATETAGATIYYTTDGTDPTGASTAYTGALTLSSTTTVKAIAIKGGMADSTVSSFTFTKFGGDSTGGGSSDNGNSGNHVTITTDPTKPNTPTTGEITIGKPDKDGNTKIPSGQITSAIEQAVRDAQKNGRTEHGVAITIKLPDGATSATLDRTALDKLIAAGVKGLTLSFPNAAMTFDLPALKELAAKATGSVTFGAVKATGLTGEALAAIGTRPAYQLTVSYQTGGKTAYLTGFGAGSVSVALAYTPTAAEQDGTLYAVYVNDSSKVEWLTKSSYDRNAKAVRFATNHFSVFGIGYKPAPTFTDTVNHWAKEDIRFVADRGLLTGTNATTFNPNGSMTRGMFVTALGRLTGVDTGKYGGSKFTDVPANAYYAPYVAWANANNIVNGTSSTTFAPDRAISREQMATILVNYAKAIGFTPAKVHEQNTFVDSANISAWAKDAVKQMQMAGILSGKSGNKFDPQGTATRGEVSAMLRRFVELTISTDTAEGWAMNDSGQWMYHENGKLIVGATKTIDGKKYTFDANGITADVPKNRRYTTYTVQPNDSFWAIAHKLGCIIAELEALNGKSQYSILYVGDVLQVPEK